MKTAIYIEDGVVQLVLTPETQFEKDTLGGFKDKPLDTQIFTGTFYDCRGGWVRQKQYYGHEGYPHEDQSLIIRTGPAKTAE